MEQVKDVRVIDEFRVAPPPGSLPGTLSSPLTLFDLPTLFNTRKHTFKCLFFYAHPQSLDDFTKTTIPSLKSSLSETLQYFYPYVSNLILPRPPKKPYFLYTEGNSVSFTVAQYSGDDFEYLTSDQAKEVGLLHLFAPRLPPTHLLADGSRRDSLLAIQVTLFPNQGICIGVGFSHAIADGRALFHFINSWAIVCRTHGNKFFMPSFDKDWIEDPYDLEAKLLNMWQDHYSRLEVHESIRYDHIYADKVQSTFVMNPQHLQKLKQYILNHGDMVNLSSYVVTCSFIWVCLIKSLETSDDDDENDKVCRLSFPVDVRNRIPEIPTSYFGNCLAGLFADVKKSELVAHNGLLVASRAIGNRINEMVSSGPLKAMTNWATAATTTTNLGSMILLIVLGSHQFDLYKKDFGWGFPNKVEVLQPHLPSVMSLSESRNEKGGLEVGLELKRVQMDAFTRFFYQGLRNSLL